MTDTPIPIEPQDAVLAAVVARVLIEEGGVVTHATEQYETRFGQTPQWLERWRLPAPKTREEAALNYRSWLEHSNLDVLCTVDDGLPDIVVDYAVHAGERKAIAALQRALGVVDDGVLGPQTMTALAMRRYPAQRRHLAAQIVADRVEQAMSLISADPKRYAWAARGWGARLARHIRRLAT